MRISGLVRRNLPQHIPKFIYFYKSDHELMGIDEIENRVLIIFVTVPRNQC